MPGNETQPVRVSETWRRRLYLPAYSIAEAARYAGTSPNTVAYWHRGTSLGPVLPGRERREPLSYLQLVEVAFVATFRKLGVSLQRIRKAREYLAQRFHSEFPFAEFRLQSEGTHILMDLKEQGEDTEVELLLIADERGQTAWKPLVGDRFAQFEYEGNLAIRWHPISGESPVIIDPRVAFGAPTVSGVPTWAIKGRWVAGETLDEISEDFGLSSEQVIEALAFEGIRVAA